MITPHQGANFVALGASGIMLPRVGSRTHTNRGHLNHNHAKRQKYALNHTQNHSSSPEILCAMSLASNSAIILFLLTRDLASDSFSTSLRTRRRYWTHVQELELRFSNS